MLKLKHIQYRGLNARQKENYNFLKLSAVLADFGYMTLRLTDDWQGADFIAQHVDGKSFMKVQLKSRLAFNKKYCGKDLYVAFSHDGDWYLYPHDELLEQVLEATNIRETVSWAERGGYSFPRITKVVKPLLEKYRLPRAE